MLLQKLPGLGEGLATVDYMTEVIAYVARHSQSLTQKSKLCRAHVGNLDFKGFFLRVSQYCKRVLPVAPHVDWVALWGGDVATWLYPPRSAFRDDMRDGM
ncbi:LtxA [Pseudomonas nabeulensis]|uniref:LtxA n=1 Tax=Pseudomonas nabeulensis TaxID=2293833 RepID=A0A4Z0B5K5_9PSED|nr:LtxA [Pseudomonas nabeulensis]